MRLLRHQRRLVEARQNELQLARIGVDVADGEDALFAGLEFRRVDGDQILFEIEAPIGDRTELHGEAEKGKHDLGRLLEGRTVGALHRHRTELAALPVELGDLTELEADVALLDEGEHLLHRGGRRAELGAPMQQRQRLGDRLQVQGPIERIVAAADDEHVAAPEMLHLAHRVEHRSAFILLDAGKRRALRREGSAAGGDHHHLGFKHGIRVGLQPEAAVEALEDSQPAG